MARSTARNGSTVRGKGTWVDRVGHRLAVRAERKRDRRAAIAEAWADVADITAHGPITDDGPAITTTRPPAPVVIRPTADTAPAPAPARTVPAITADGPALAVLLADGTAAVIRPGSRLVVGWSGGGRGKSRGFRGPDAAHNTERVHAIDPAAGSVVLVGGAYDPRAGHTVPVPADVPDAIDGRGRVLRVVLANGTTSRQVRAVL
jgi:hypothetical protein